jgi:hypothetical protein
MDDTPNSPGWLFDALAGAIIAKLMAPALAKCRP